MRASTGGRRRPECRGLAAVRARRRPDRFNGVITFTNYSIAGRRPRFVQTTKGRKVRLDGMGVVASRAP